MVKNITSILVPPLAVCRYSCTSDTAPAVGLAWVTGLSLLGYHFFANPHANNLIGAGSLILGATLVALAIVWAHLTIKQVETESASLNSNPSSLCRVLPSSNEKDPLVETDRLKKL